MKCRIIIISSGSSLFSKVPVYQHQEGKGSKEPVIIFITCFRCWSKMNSTFSCFKISILMILSLLELSESELYSEADDSMSKLELHSTVYPYTGLKCLPELSESELDSEADDSLSELELLSILYQDSAYLNFLSQN